MTTQKKIRGFTLIELMVVLSIIAILMIIAMPTADNRLVKAQIVESTELIKTYKEQVAALFQVTKLFPKNNKDAGFPQPELIMGNFAQRVEIKDGAFNIIFGNKAHTQLKDKILTIRPLIVKGSTESPMSWLCGNSAVPDGMQAVGDNLTNVPAKFLPVNCL